MSDELTSFDRMIGGLRAGDSLAIRGFCGQYGAALERLADKHLMGDVRRRVGAEDVVQSACRTFFRRARVGEFELSDSEGLWGLLCAITLVKVREQARFHLRKKRGLDREVHAAGDTSTDGNPIWQAAAAEPSAAEAVEFADQFAHLIESLDEEERQLVDLKLQQYTNDEIAARMGCSERTVRRILKRVQSVLTRQFAESQESEG